jgi:hypothetical protein
MMDEEPDVGQQAINSFSLYALSITEQAMKVNIDSLTLACVCGQAVKFLTAIEVNDQHKVEPDPERICEAFKTVYENGVIMRDGRPYMQ